LIFICYISTKKSKIPTKICKKNKNQKTKGKTQKKQKKNNKAKYGVVQN